GTEAAKAIVNRMQDVLAREAFLIGIVSDGKENFRRDHQAVARRTEILERPAQDLLAHAHGVHVSGIKEVDAEFQRPLDKGTTLFFFENPFTPLLAAVCHAAQTNSGDLCAGGT